MFQHNDDYNLSLIYNGNYKYSHDGCYKSYIENNKDNNKNDMYTGAKDYEVFQVVFEN